MNPIRLYLDEDASQNALVEALRNAAVDVMTTSEGNNTGRSDKEQLIWATEQGRVIYTFNMGDFCRLHSTFMAQGKSHAGIIAATRQRYSVGVQLRGILRLMAAQSAEEMIKQLEFISAYIRDE